MVKFIPSIMKTEIRGMVQEGETMVSGSYDNLLLSYDKPDGGKWGGLTLTKMMVDAHKFKQNKTEPLYKINKTPVSKSSALYLIRCRNANKSLFKIGRASKLVRRLASYKTALPLDNEILLIAALIIPDPFLIVAVEKVLIANLRHFAEIYPTRLKQLRKTEHYTRGAAHFGEALALRCFFCLATHIAKTRPNLDVHIHLFGTAALLEMFKLPNIGFTPRFDVVPKKWKGMTPLEQEISDAEASLVEDEDDRGFSKKQLAAVLDPSSNFEDVVVFIDAISAS
jgi:hypothetical protein